MVQHVKWRLPDEADDLIHFLSTDNEFTLCSLAFEGVESGIEQDFVATKRRVTCGACIQTVIHCKSISAREWTKDGEKK